MRRRGERRKRGVGVVDRVPQAAHDVDAGAVAPGRGHRETAGRDDDARGEKCAAVREAHPPRGRRVADGDLAAPAGWDRGIEPVNVGVEARLDAIQFGHRAQGIADVLRLVRNREELSGLLLERERDREIFLEEAPLLPEWPGEEELLQGIRGGGGHETRRVELGGEDIATPSPAHEDLPAAVVRSFKEEHAARAVRGRAGWPTAGFRPPSRENRRDEARCVRADYHDGIAHLSILVGFPGRRGSWLHLNNAYTGHTLAAIH